MSLGIYEALIPAEPIVSGFAEPRLVSFADVDETDAPKDMGSEARGILLRNRIAKVTAALKSYGGRCTSAQISDKAEMHTSTVSRVLQHMRENGLVKSRLLGVGRLHEWELVCKN